MELSREALQSLVDEGREWMGRHDAPLDPVLRWSKKIEMALMDMDDPLVQGCLKDFMDGKEALQQQGERKVADVMLFVEQNINLLELAIQSLDQKAHMLALQGLDSQLRGLNRRMTAMVILMLLLLVGLLIWQWA